MNTLVLTHDVTDGGIEVKHKIIEVSSYNWPNYISLSIGMLDILKGLSKKAYIFFKHIVDNIPINNNYIILTTENIKNIINEKYDCNVYTILHELINKNIIAKSDDFDNKNKYVICHNLFFKGNYNQFIYKYNKIYGEFNDIEDVDDW